jgi:hypothetical protein
MVPTSYVVGFSDNLFRDDEELWARAGVAPMTNEPMFSASIRKHHPGDELDKIWCISMEENS